MLSRTTKLAAVITLVGAASLGTAATVHASTDTEDYLSPASTTVTANLSPGTKFVAMGTLDGIPLTVTCTSVTASGTTPAQTKHSLSVTVKPPVFSGCTDNSGGTDTVTNTGTWKLTEIDAANDEAQTEPNTTDKGAIVIPQNGSTFKSSILSGCTVTVAPAGAFKLTGKYPDNGVLTFKNAPLLVTGTGCTVGPPNTPCTTKTAPPNDAYTCVTATEKLSVPVFDAS